ncbi:hypothetical protein MPTK1_3g12867 [Marchantia polymorpha subsp. ruderalis]
MFCSLRFLMSKSKASSCHSLRASVFGSSCRGGIASSMLAPA